MTKVLTNHAEYKTPVHNLFKILQTVLEDIIVTTSFDMDPSNKIKHEYDVGVYGKIDFLVKVEKKTTKKIFIFAIEIMASKVEAVELFSHKMLQARTQLSADKSFFITLDVKETGIVYSIEERMEILRRWVIFAINYEEYLPSMNIWSFFSSSRKPYAKKPNTSAFFDSPVEIKHAPRGIKSDWEFCTDPYTMSVNARTIKAESNYYNKVNLGAISVNELLFGGHFENGIYNTYAKYNIDDDNNPYAKSCTNDLGEPCPICKLIVGNHVPNQNTIVVEETRDWHLNHILSPILE